MTAFRVKWYHTEEFECDIELDDAQMEEVNAAKRGDPGTYDDAETVLTGMLMSVIEDMEQPQLSLAFQGCTDREITEKAELES